MGPTLISDKSFLQSITVDESVWLDNFYLNIICPIFFSETLADLSKNVRSGRTPEQEVRIVSNKTPEMSIAVNAFHKDLCIANLGGYSITMDRRPLVPGGKPVESKDEKGVVFESPQEQLAFSRWQEEKFLDLERDYAKKWRDETEKIDYNKFLKICDQYRIEIPKCKSLEEAKCKAELLLNKYSSPMNFMKFVFTALDIPPQMFMQTYHEWGNLGCPSLNRFAPYAYYVLTIELFFHIAINSGFISGERKSNKIDISYLYYLPFCNLFVSTDKLHKRCAPLFMTENQEFLWGPDMKQDLKKIDLHYNELPDAVKEQGLHSFASQPPMEGDFLVSKIWDKYLPSWRNKRSIPQENLAKLQNSELHAKMKGLANAEELPPEKVDFLPDEADLMVIKRNISRKKGKWHQIGKHIIE